MSDQLHAPAALALRNSPRYELYKRLGAPKSRAGRYEEEKNLTPIPTELSQPCSPLKVKSSACCLPYVGLLIGVFFDPEDRSDMANFQRCMPKIGIFITTAVEPQRLYTG
jgi:hypothetical protein